MTSPNSNEIQTILRRNRGLSREKQSSRGTKGEKGGKGDRKEEKQRRFPFG